MKRAAAAILLLSLPLQAEDFDALFQRHAAAHRVDWRLVKAIAEVESHLNPRAVNRSDPSLGLMQIRCVEDRRGGCSNRFDVAGWPPARREQLFDPEYNVSIGTQVLAWNVRTFGLERGIAVYNQWDARLTPPGKPFPNAGYVGRAMLVYRRLIEAESSLALQCQPWLGVATQGVARPGAAQQGKGCSTRADSTSEMRPAGGVANNTRSQGRDRAHRIPPHGDRAGLPTIRAK